MADPAELVPVLVDPGSQRELVGRIRLFLEPMPPPSLADLAAHLLAAELLDELACTGAMPEGHPLVQALGLGLGPRVGRA